MLDGRMVGGYTLGREGANFGVEECLAGTNSLYPLLSIRTVTMVRALAISLPEIRDALREL